MENNSPPASATKVTAPANEPPKTGQACSNHEVVPMAARTTAMDGSAAQPQRGTAVGSVPLTVQQHPQPLSRSMLQVLEVAGTGTGTGTGSMSGTTAQCGATMPRSPTAVGSLARRPVQQTNPVVFGQGSSSSNQATMQGSASTQAMAATALLAATPGPTAQHGAALPPPAFLPAPRVRRTKLMITRPPAPPPPKLPVYRPPAPPRPELARSFAAGNALMLQPSPDTGFRVPNMQADPPSSDQVTVVEVGSDSEGGGDSGDDVVMLDLNFPPVSNEEN